MEIQSVAQIRADIADIEAAASGMAGNVIRPPSDHADASQAASFAASMREAIHSVDRKEQDAASKAEAVDSGKSDDLVGAMLASQEAGLSFSMLMQVRNKVMGAFDELIKLQL
jgi:flagellar hook-basal body complex protein FliE